MAANSAQLIPEVLPKQGQLYDEDLPSMVLCKPKLLPLKSVTLEKLEKMQKDAEQLVRQQDLIASQQQTDAFGHIIKDSDINKDGDASSSQEEADRLVL